MCIYVFVKIALEKITAGHEIVMVAIVGYLRDIYL